MVDPATGAVDDVVLLMLIRHMPEADFLVLCSATLDGVSDAEIKQTYFARYTDEEPAEVARQDPTPLVCRVCRGPLGDHPETERLSREQGLIACKACIDEAIFARFGPGLAVPIETTLAARARHA